MKVRLLNPDGIRESVPVELEIRAAKGIPQVHVEGLGDVEVKGKGEHYTAQFWTMEKGHYAIRVQDQSRVWRETLVVREQSYLGFAQEFGFFLVCMVIASLGVVLWVRKLKKIGA